MIDFDKIDRLLHLLEAGEIEKIIEESKQGYVVNGDDTSGPLPFPEFKVEIFSNEGEYKPPHIHVTKGDTKIKVFILTGELYNVISEGSFSISKLVKLTNKWLPLPSTSNPNKTNREMCMEMWRHRNPNWKGDKKDKQKFVNKNY
jgi:hypothetical protein